MNAVKRLLHRGFLAIEAPFDVVFTPAWNPFHNLGALGFFYYWIVAVSGIYLYVGFETGVTKVYTSIEYLTHTQWYLGGVMRSLHRYASDAMVVMMLVHVLREFAMDRLRGVRWFTWVTGVPILWLVYASGITGYWLVWDELAQYVALATTEWLDWLPIFGDPVARNFLTTRSLDDRFFTLMIFLHIAVPLILLFILWVHLQRLSQPRINPPRGLAFGSLAMMLALSLAKPAVSHGPADLALVPGTLKLDWFYLGAYPLLDVWSHGSMWAAAAGITVGLALLPWLPPFRRPTPAFVTLEHCNGCGRCIADCPYAAVSLTPRTDGLPFSRQATVDPELCVSCGICVGACPTSIAFRRTPEIRTGIDLAHFRLQELREQVLRAARRPQSSPRTMVFVCEHGVDSSTAPEAIAMPCIGMLPPSFIDFVLSRDAADGVVLAGCRDGVCYNRRGQDWMEQRIAGERDPYLRARVPRERVLHLRLGRGDEKRLNGAVAAFAGRLVGLPAPVKSPPPTPIRAEPVNEGAPR
jgi:ferredoxin